MTDNNNGQKKKPYWIYIVGALFVVLLAGALLSQTKPPAGAPPADQPPVADATGQTAPEDATDVTEATQTAATPVTTVIDVNVALSDRILGSTSAPLKVSEHASLTCSHCADFHKNNFAKFKKDYIDTGKAYLVFSDFPLNAPALEASAVARCLPEGKYFDFIGLLFEKQEDWAFDNNYRANLKTLAGENGLSGDVFESCLAKKEIQDGIKNRMTAVQTQWQISSTPSFVLNNKAVIAGNQPYEEFAKLLDQEIAKVKAGSQTDAAPPATPAETPAEESAAEPSEAPAATTTPATEPPTEEEQPPSE